MLNLRPSQLRSLWMALFTASTAALVVTAACVSDSDEEIDTETDTTTATTSTSQTATDSSTTATTSTSTSTSSDTVDPNVVARGKYVVDVVGSCTLCHTPYLPTGASDTANYLGGANCFFDIDPGNADFGCMTAPNLTNHNTGLANHSDAQIKALLLTGVRPDGTFLHSTMPYWSYGNMSDDDASAVVAYLRTVPGLDRAIPRPQAPFDMVAAPATRLDLSLVPQPDPAYPELESATRGRYLASNVGLCLECHTPETAEGSAVVRDMTKPFWGGRIFDAASLGLPVPPFPATIYSTNLTPDVATGSGSYTIAQIVTALKTGVDNAGKGICAPMPAGAMAPLSGLTDQDATDIANFLHSIPAVSSAIPNTCAL